MNAPRMPRIAALIGASLALSACAQSAPVDVALTTSATSRASAAMAETEPTRIAMIVHKSAQCSCCGGWVEHMQRAGFAVEVRDQDDLLPVKQRLGVPLDKAACHTAEVGPYIVEGHIPAGDIRRLLAERPLAHGLVLPGMPAGSPGMEMPGVDVPPYTVELLGKDGRTAPYSRHGEAAG